MTKPHCIEGTRTCPKCSNMDTVAMVQDQSEVGWCSCGTVWVYDFDASTEPKILYDFCVDIKIEYQPELRP